jgi:predicted RNA-binding protein YlqC (UPF0109 family)
MNNEQIEDKQFLEMIVKALVEKPEEVTVDRKVDERGVLLTLKVAKTDMGKVIGKMGQAAKALRTLLRILASTNNSRVNLKIFDPEGSHNTTVAEDDVDDLSL